MAITSEKTEKPAPKEIKKPIERREESEREEYFESEGDDERDHDGEYLEQKQAYKLWKHERKQ